MSAVNTVAVDFAVDAMATVRQLFFDVREDDGLDIGQVRSEWLAILTEALSVEISLFNPASHSEALNSVVSSLVADHSASAAAQ